MKRKLVWLCALVLLTLGTAWAATAQQHFAEGFEFIKAGKLQQAASKFEAGLKAEPGNAQAHFYLAETYLGLKQNDQAKAHYQKALQLDPFGPAAQDAKDRLGQLTGGGGRAAGSEIKDCDVCPAMVVVPAGQFIMGSPPSETGRSGDEGPPHKVAIARPFAVGKFEVSFDEWQACIAERACGQLDDSGFGRGSRPVINVSYDQAVGYTEWLSDKTGKKYRLLSEAEWEYAARAGSDRSRYWGSAPDRACQFANVNDQTSKRVNNFSWEGFDCDDGYAKTAPVGQFKPNAFGLYDMLGNVWEWVEDCYNASYEGAPSDGSAWSTGDCSRRVRRGGSWIIIPAVVRSAKRNRSVPSKRDDDLGFRVARTLP